MQVMASPLSICDDPCRGKEEGFQLPEFMFCSPYFGLPVDYQQRYLAKNPDGYCELTGTDTGVSYPIVGSVQIPADDI